MEQPPGYITQGNNMVCKLKKTTNGLKQFSRLIEVLYIMLALAFGGARSFCFHSTCNLWDCSSRHLCG